MPRSFVASLASVSAAALLSSTIAAFCCVVWSMPFTAPFTYERPVDCSRAAVEFATTWSLISTISLEMVLNARPVSLTSFAPVELVDRAVEVIPQEFEFVREGLRQL